MQEPANWDGKVYDAAHFNEGPKPGTVAWANAEQARFKEEQRLQRQLENSRKWTEEAIAKAADQCGNPK
jgi:hypothetical protein